MMSDNIKNLVEPTPESISRLITENNLPSYRTGQVLEWFWKKKQKNPLNMSNLPAGLREELSEKLYVPKIKRSNKSSDKTVLFNVRFYDGNEVETVLIRERHRMTVCVSSAVGCPYGCLFCATGKMGFVRQLSPYEIAVQPLLVSSFDVKNTVTNVVLMGMGEPFHDYRGTLEACDMLNDKRMMNIGQRKITVSTAGVVPGINYFSNSSKQYKLAVSLNSPRDSDRKKIMPIARKWPLASLIESVKKYTEATNKKVTFEYVLIKGFNDRLSDAQKTSELLKGILCKVNLIPYNRAVIGFDTPDPSSVLRFQDALKREGVETTTRLSRGADISAACGQLAVRADRKTQYADKNEKQAKQSGRKKSLMTKNINKRTGI